MLIHKVSQYDKMGVVCYECYLNYYEVVLISP